MSQPLSTKKIRTPMLPGQAGEKWLGQGKNRGWSPKPCETRTKLTASALRPSSERLRSLAITREIVGHSTAVPVIPREMRRIPTDCRTAARMEQGRGDTDLLCPALKD